MTDIEFKEGDFVYCMCHDEFGYLRKSPRSDYAVELNGLTYNIHGEYYNYRDAALYKISETYLIKRVFNV